MGEPIADIDIATTLKPEQVMEAAKRADLGVKPTGLDHGTVMLIADHKPFEVTTLRVDAETFGRRARVAFTDDWAADAGRRDFTMNALYCDCDGTILDLVDGYRDIKRRLVRFVGKPKQRIEEDYLRILRFFRFHARYGRGALDADGLKACIRLRNGMARLSRERIRQELLKLLVAPRAAQTIAIMERSKILHQCLPGPFALPHLRKLQALDARQGFMPDAILRLYVLTPRGTSLGKELRLSNDETSRLSRLRSAPQLSPALRERERRVVLYMLGAAAWRDAVKAQWAQGRAAVARQDWRDLHDLPDHWAIPRFPVNGRQLIDAGLAEGPELGGILARLEDFWIASDFAPSREDLLKRVQEGK
jgi:poly(A) polymerase